jgi:hypothetical protein
MLGVGNGKDPHFQQLKENTLAGTWTKWEVIQRERICRRYRYIEA